jgi:hypothetical protein
MVYYPASVYTCVQLYACRWASRRSRADGRFRATDADFSMGGGGGGGRGVVRRPLPLECVGVGGTLGATLGRGARAGGGKSRARRGRDGAGERGGELGAKGVARVVSDRLPAKHQPLRAG